MPVSISGDGDVSGVSVDKFISGVATDGDVLTYGLGAWGPAPRAKVVNTDGNPGYTIFVGATDPSISYTMVPGDIWIEVPA